MNKNTLNVRGLLFGEPQRLKFVNRFCTVFRIQEESVAEHCFFTAFYAMAMVDWLRICKNRQNLNKYEVVARALMHDLEESITGDFPRPFKHSHPSLTMRLEEASNQAMGMALKDLHAEKRLADLWMTRWCNAKTFDDEGRIVRLADFMSCVQYVALEVGAGNRALRNFLYKGGALREYYNEFENPEYDFLREIVDQLYGILEENEL